MTTNLGDVMESAIGGIPDTVLLHVLLGEEHGAEESSGRPARYRPIRMTIFVLLSQYFEGHNTSRISSED